MINVQNNATIAPVPRRIPAGADHVKASSRPVVTYSGTQQNELLAALPRDILESLFEHLELVTLPFGKELFECGGTMD